MLQIFITYIQQVPGSKLGRDIKCCFSWDFRDSTQSNSELKPNVWLPFTLILIIHRQSVGNGRAQSVIVIRLRTG